jgi:cation:H+ antiporter
MILSLLTVSASYILLYLGTRSLMKGCFRVAPDFGKPAVFSDLLKYSLILSSPAFFVGLSSALNGSGAIIVGSVIGSNMFNLCFILGISAFIIPLRTNQKMNKLLILFLIASSVIFMILFNDRSIDWEEGVILLSILLAFTFISLFMVQAAEIHNYTNIQEDEKQSIQRNWYFYLFQFLSGLIALLAGSWLLIARSSEIAGKFGIGETLFGLTIASAGISIPILAGSLKSASKKNVELVIGLVVWSCIMNILGVTGVAALVKPLSAMAISNFDLFATIGIALLQLQFLHHRYKLRRDEAVFIVFLYIIFIYYLLPK